MKKVLACMLVLCMLMAFVPAISFAADTKVTASQVAFFTPSSSLGTVEGSGESGGSCVLVAYNGSDNWNAANTFTDTDGTVTNQTVTSGVAFGTSRQAVVSFDIPADYDADNVAKVTLGLTVRFVKQIDQAGARLAVYGNSVDGSWTTSSNKSIFGVSGADSGTGSLPLLGLTTPINSAGNNHIDQEITLSSKALKNYIAEMAEEGKTQVTFRLAVPYGGVWIYNNASAYAPTLTVEEGSLTSVNINTVYMDGEFEVGSETETVENIVAGKTYTHPIPTYAVEYDGETYVYDEEASTLSVTATADGNAAVEIVYTKFDESKSFSGYEVDDEGAWCWFADPRSITYANDEGTLDFSIMGYIDIHGNIKATQVNHLTDEVNEVLIRSNIQPDDHNNPTFLVLPDERIIVFYSRHTDEPCFWYRVTKEKGDLTTLGEEKCINTSANTTYPSPFILSDDPDHIYLCWRGIEWHPTIAKLSMPDEDGNTEFVYGPYQLVRSTNAASNIRPYAKYASNGVDKIYITYTATHPDNFEHNWYYFNQVNINNMTLEDINGNTMSTIASGPLVVNHTNQSNLIDSTNNVRNWVWQIAIDENGYPVVANVKINGGKNSHDYYYVKWNGTEWVTTFLTNAGGHFHQSGHEQCYSGGMAIDPENTNVMYCSVPVEGVFGKVYEIVKYTMSDDGTEVVSTEQITYNSKKNNVRPFVIPESEGRDIRLVWMYGDYTDWIVSNAHPTAYGTAVHAEAPLPVAWNGISEVLDAFARENYLDIGEAFVSTKETANIVEAEVDGDFTVYTEIYLDDSYEGTLFDIGDVQVSVKTMQTQYGANATGDRARVVVTVNGTDYVSSNVYGSSDCWTTYGRGTGGNYGVENYQGYVSHMLTFDGEYLTLYREGLVDIKIPAENLSVDNVTVGGFDGQVRGVIVWDRVLTHDEIKFVVDQEREVVVPDADGDLVITKKYVDTKGNTMLPDEEVTLPAGTDLYNFVPEETIKTENGIYTLYDTTEADGVYTAIYEKTQNIGTNLIYNGDMSITTTDGTYTYVSGWQGGYTNRTHHELSDRPYLYESGAWMSTTDAHFIYTPATEDEPASITTPAASTMNGGAVYPWQSDTSEPYMGLVLTSWMMDAENPDSYLKAEEGKTYIMSFEIKATEINGNSWVNNVVGFDAVTVSGDNYKNQIPGTNGDINTLTSVLDTHIGRNKYTKNANEWVTVEVTATATADGYFVFQLGWGHEWGQTSVRSFSVREVVDVPKATVTATLEGTKVTVTPEGVDEGNVIAVSVNNSEKVYTKVYAGEALEFPLEETPAKVEVFVWKSIASMTPVCEKVIIE